MDPWREPQTIRNELRTRSNNEWSFEVKWGTSPEGPDDQETLVKKIADLKIPYLQKKPSSDRTPAGNSDTLGGQQATCGYIWPRVPPGFADKPAGGASLKYLECVRLGL